MKIYMAGPLFTTAEREFNAALAKALRAAGFEIWLPQESEQQADSAKSIFDIDVAGIDWSELVLGCMDGPDPDSGTCWECGAVFRRKPVVLYRTDIRDESAPLGPFNLMMHQSAALTLDCKWLSTEQVAEKIITALRSLMEKRLVNV
jgi:nucleoside 2-deoxyribosyltransferase